MLAFTRPWLKTSLIVATTLLLARSAAALPTGISGYSGLTPANSCITCHPGGNPPIGSLTGPAALPPGGTAQYTFTLKTAKLFGGLDVAVDNAGAKLATVSAKTQLLQGEITHTEPLAPSNGAIVVKFNLTAPATEGTVTLHADGQADNKPQIADSSAVPVQLKVTVKAGVPLPDGGVVMGGADDMGTDNGGVGGGGAQDDAGTPDPGVGGGAADAPTPASTMKHGCSFAVGAGGDDASVVAVAGLLLIGLALLRRRARG